MSSGRHNFVVLKDTKSVGLHSKIMLYSINYIYYSV